MVFSIDASNPLTEEIQQWLIHGSQWLPLHGEYLGLLLRVLEVCCNFEKRSCSRKVSPGLICVDLPL